MKVENFKDAKKFTDIPNIGPALSERFVLLGFKTPQDLKGKDPLVLYKKLSRLTDRKEDPCVLDTFMAAIDFMNGKGARPWWKYTAERKKKYMI